MRTPPPVFCMVCGPGTSLDRDLGAHLLRCPRCGAVEPLPAHPLFVVTGASGAGKTSVVEPLRRRLPACEVFDSDIILHVAALGWDAWRGTWLQLAHAISLNGRATVLCGSLMPDQLAGLPGRRLLSQIHFCNLDCPDDVRADRLRRRTDWRGSSSDEVIAEHERFAAWLRANIHPTFDTGHSTPAAIADRVAGWIEPLLAVDQVDEGSPIRARG